MPCCTPILITAATPERPGWSSKPNQMVRGATMAVTSVNDRNDADLAIGYRAALRRAAAACGR